MCKNINDVFINWNRRYYWYHIYKRVTQRLYYTTVHIIKKHFLLLNIIYTHTTLSIHIQHVHVPQDMFHLVLIFIIFFLFLIRGNEFNITTICPYLRCLLAIPSPSNNIFTWFQI